MYFQSHLQYCLVAYGSSFPSVHSPLIVLQKKAIRLITKSSHLAHTSNLFNSMQILSFYKLYYFRCLCFIKKHYDTFNFQLSYSRRLNYFVSQNTYRTTRALNSLEHRSVFLLNAINIDIREATKITYNEKKMLFTR